MLAVHGVGELKYQKYGEQFLALCQKLAGESCEEDVINALHDYNFEIIQVKRKGEWVAIASRYKG